MPDVPDARMLGKSANSLSEPEAYPKSLILVEASPNVLQDLFDPTERVRCERVVVQRLGPGVAFRAISLEQPLERFLSGMDLVRVRFLQPSSDRLAQAIEVF